MNEDQNQQKIQPMKANRFDQLPEDFFESESSISLDSLSLQEENQPEEFTNSNLPESNRHHFNRFMTSENVKSRDTDLMNDVDRFGQQRCLNSANIFGSSPNQQQRQSTEASSDSAVREPLQIDNMAARDLQRPDESQMLQRYANMAIKEEFICGIFVTVSLLFSPADEESPKDDESCQVHFHQTLLMYLITVILPVFMITHVARFCLMRQKKQEAYQAFGARISFLTATQIIWCFVFIMDALSITGECITFPRILLIINYSVLLVVSILWTAIWILFLIIALYGRHRFIWDLELIGRRMVNSSFKTVKTQAQHLGHARARNSQGSNQICSQHLTVQKFCQQFNSHGVDECIICIEKFVEGQSDIVCLSHNKKHIFHAKCIEEWLKSKPECPICRVKIDLKQEDLFRQEQELIQYERDTDNNC